MAKSGDAPDEPDEDEMSPDEREAIAERLESLEDEDRYTLSEVADAVDTDE